MTKFRYLFPIAALVGLLIGVFTNALLAQSPGVNSPYNPVWSIPIDSIKRTYSQSVMQLSASGTASSDIVQLCGAAGVTTKLVRATFSGRATAVQPVDVILIKRSNWDTGGTVYAGGGFAGLSAVGIPNDANDAASVAAVTPYTASPTLGTAVGVINTAQAYLGNLTTGISGQPPVIFDYGNRPDKAPTLRSATQCVAVGLSPTSIVNGGLFDINMEWTEE